MVWPFQCTRTFCALMVMPRSRSRSIESRYCSRMSRASTAPVSSRMRSDSVDLPWSTWAMIEKLRMRERSMGVIDATAGCREQADHVSWAPWVAWHAQRCRTAGECTPPRCVAHGGLKALCCSGCFASPQARRTSMANIKSQKKRNLTNAKAHERNKAVRSELKTRVKVALRDSETGAENAG